MALTATLELSDAKLTHPSLLELRVRVTNDGTAPERFSTAAFAGSVAFDVTGLDGAPVALGPPPMPPAGEPESELAPGEGMDLTFYGDEVFGELPPPGRYRVRFAPGPVTSPWVEFST